MFDLRNIPFPRLVYGLLGLVLLSVCAAHSSFSAERVRAGASDLKSAYIFNFIRFTEWPELANASRGSAVRLNILNDSEVHSIMQSIANKAVAKQIGLSVESCSRDSCVQGASVLFIGKSDSGDYQRLLKLAAGRPVLTISDIPGFAKQGGMIEIKYHNKKLTFVVNVQAVKHAGLYISAQLLQLGEIVGRDNE